MIMGSKTLSGASQINCCNFGLEVLNSGMCQHGRCAHKYWNLSEDVQMEEQLRHTDSHADREPGFLVHIGS